MSSISRVPKHVKIIVALSLLVALCPRASALDPSLDISQYAHTAWKVRDGFVKGAIFSIAQTPDGYLWLGTEFGLFRFDGVRVVPWQPPSGEQLPNNFINNLLVSRDGALWIGTHRGLARWKDGRLNNYPELAALSVSALRENREGIVWIGARGLSAGNFCAAKDVTVQCYGAGQFGRGVSALYEDHNGNLWVSAATGLWRWAPGPPDRYPFPPDVLAANALIEDDSGVLLISTPAGLKQLVDGEIQSYLLPGVMGHVWPERFLRSSDGSLWISTLQGLLRLHQGRVDGFRAVDGLSADFVTPIFEDREGNVWVGTQEGLDRFREVAAPTVSRKQGLSNSAAWSVQATPDGSIWIGTADGLNRWKNGHATVYRSRKALNQDRQDEPELSTSRQAGDIANTGLTGDTQSLGQDARGRLWASTSDGVFYFESGHFVRIPDVPGGYTSSVAGDGYGNVWISNFHRGLFYWTERRAVQQIPVSRFGEKHVYALLPDRSQGGLWLGFDEGGIAYLKDGQVGASYNAANGLGDGRVNGLRFDLRSALWADTEGGLSRIQDGHVATLSSKNGLPCDMVHWSVEDDDDGVWLYMPCGLVRIVRSELDAWASDAKRTVDTAVFGIADGVRSPGITGGYPPRVTKSSDGRIWFLPRDGVSVIDPRRVPRNDLPPPVHVEQFTADRKTYDSSSDLHLPALTRDLQIDYTALSLVAPENNQFRYKLEGHDPDWQNVGNRRQAFYNDLPPGSYRFRVVASNNSGVWNEEGAALDFSVAPAYWQTAWFRALCVTAILLVLWALYQLRLRQIARAFNTRLEERVAERTRIARELHDTLLQNFQGLLLRFQTVLALCETRPAEAKEVLRSSIDETAQAITEGREAVQGLRASTVERNDLAHAITILGEEIAAEASSHPSVGLNVEVEGTPRSLHPIVRDEIYRIVGEALRNAFRHAEAKQIEVELRYDLRQLRLRVRDDGEGIDPKFLAAEGRAGHFGLLGMRERAKLVRGKLTIWTAPDSGTEIELSVPAAHAYTSPSRSWFSEKFSGKDRETEE
jgi:signal transduction histidine kinase/ligand-binding sensor domain-containing protein